MRCRSIVPPAFKRKSDPASGELLNDKRSSYEFHCSLESSREFFGRERRTAALCTILFALVTVAAVLWLDPAFFYPRLQTDPLNYYL